MDLVLGAGGGGGPSASTSLGHENGPILFTETNRTSAVDDLRSVVIYVFIVTIFVGFFLILPGIRNEKFPTFLCVTTSLLVTSIILVALFGTTWHVGQASIAAPYKAHSMDRIQGLLRVKVGLSSVNITLQAHKYYQLQQLPPSPTISSEPAAGLANASSRPPPTSPSPNNLADELLEERTADGTSVDTELETDEEAFPPSPPAAPAAAAGPRAQRSVAREPAEPEPELELEADDSPLRYSVDERPDLDINYNERFYWIEPQQMRQEHHQALERGLPYPILTVVEYLSQDEAGFSWSRQYRSAGYYSHILLWLGLCLCALMFFLHCATPKYGIYAMQLLGALLLLTNLTYSILVPRGDQRLVIPFEGQSLELQFGWNYWLVFLGGCLSLSVGTLIVLIDSLFPNYIFTTILDVDFDSHNKYYKNKQGQLHGKPLERPTRPPFIQSKEGQREEEGHHKGNEQGHSIAAAAAAAVLTSGASSSPAASPSRRNSPTAFSSPSNNSTSEMQLQQRHHRKQQPAKRDPAPETEPDRPQQQPAATSHLYAGHKQTKSPNPKGTDQRSYGSLQATGPSMAANDVRL